MEQPFAGKGAFQETEASVHWVGKPPARVLPLFFGPRHWGHPASAAPVAKAAPVLKAAPVAKAGAGVEAHAASKSETANRRPGEVRLWGRGERMGVVGWIEIYRLKILLQPYSRAGEMPDLDSAGDFDSCGLGAVW